MNPVLFALLFCVFTSAEDDPEQLVRQLADDKLETRENAAERLIRLGEHAREALRRAAASSDAEVKSRAAALLKRLDVYAELRSWYAPERRVTLSDEMTLEAAVREIERQTGQTIAASSWPEGTFRLELRDVPYWEALETVCRMSGKRSLAPGTSGPRLIGEQYVKAPAVHSGPFRIEAGDITERRSFDINSGRGEKNLTLGMAVAWESSIAPVRSYLALTRVEDDSGRDLLPGFEAYEKRVSSGYAPRFLEEKRVFLNGFAKTTTNPPQAEVKRLSRIEGAVTLYVQGAPGEMDLPLPAPGEATRSEITIYDEKLENPSVVKISLSETSRKDTSFQCKLSIQNVDVRLVNNVFNYLYLRDGAGKRYQGTPGSISLPENARIFSLNFDGVPASAELSGLTIRLPKKLVRKEIPFVFKDVQLR